MIYSEQEDNLKPYEITWENSDESIFRKAEAIKFGTTDGSYDVFSHGLFGEAIDCVADCYPHLMPLLRIEEEDRWGLRFYDCGTYYFVISRKALAERNFSEARGKLFFF